MEKTVALYIRTSTDMQANGMDSQQKALESYCLQRGIKDYLIYKDFGVSGSKLNRPGLDKMMEDVRDGKISTVCVYSFSRYARSSKALILGLEEFTSLGITFVSLSENLDLSTPLGVAVYQILASLAQLERSIIKERVTNGLRAAKARGKKLGAKRKDVNMELLKNLKAQNLSYNEIGKLLKISSASVCRRLKEASVSEKRAG